MEGDSLGALYNELEELTKPRVCAMIRQMFFPMEALEAHLHDFSCQNSIYLLHSDLMAAAFQEFLWWAESWRYEGDEMVVWPGHLVTFQCGMEVIRDSFAVPPNTGNSISRPPIIAF